MPCSDSSSSIALRLDSDDRFFSFDFAKITCGREISAKTGYSQYCKGKALDEILSIPYTQAVTDLGVSEEEGQFILYLEWDALRATLAEYLGAEIPDVDHDRCRITSVSTTIEGTEVALVVLPPKEMPKILPCNLANS